jgi:hypothetical protein
MTALLIGMTIGNGAADPTASVAHRVLADPTAIA